MYTVRTEGLDALIRTLDPRLVERAHVRATNRSLTKGRTDWSREIRKDYVVKAGDVKRSSRLLRLKAGARRAGLELEGPSLPLKAFSPRRTAQGVSVKIRKRDPRKVVKGAFIVDSAGGHVFQRSGAARLPIAKLFTVAIPQMAERPSVINDTLAAIQVEYRKEFRRQLELLGEAL